MIKHQFTKRDRFCPRWRPKKRKSRLSAEEENKQSLQSRLHLENRTTDLAVTNFTDVDLAWAAGFLEGEASFGKTTTNWNRTSTQRITCRQVNIEPLERLLRMFGGHFGLIKAPSQKKVGISEWRCTGSRARIVMRLIRSLMTKRRQGQIDLALLGT